MHVFKILDLFDIWSNKTKKDEKFSAIWDYVRETGEVNIHSLNEKKK